jgi:hypothetical protein
MGVLLRMHALHLHLQPLGRLRFEAPAAAHPHRPQTETHCTAAKPSNVVCLQLRAAGIPAMNSLPVCVCNICSIQAVLLKPFSAGGLKVRLKGSSS